MYYGNQNQACTLGVLSEGGSKYVDDKGSVVATKANSPSAKIMLGTGT